MTRGNPELPDNTGTPHSSGSADPDSLPGVSYVMPVLNEVEHIEAAVLSLVDQDYTGPFEVVLALAVMGSGFALFAVAGIAPLIFRLMGRSAFYVLSAVPAAGFIWLLMTFGAYTGTGQGLGSGQPNGVAFREFADHFGP